MRALILFLFLIIFVGELTLDASTSFVRSSSAEYTYNLDNDPSSSSNDPADSSKAKTAVRHLESSAHSALPILQVSTQFWVNSEDQASFAEITIPHLNPPRSRINRPPIV